ncbi:jg13642 [Pararge aegeria aegeria]|uniref:Jg13642 protein n=1 Tax=Pararge aegeria aegeria TaxID=348720 RepID=A0A8S4S8I4_9NEOP|nr:jg13642 [Pararge aegeria aegeria]
MTSSAEEPELLKTKAKLAMSREHVLRTDERWGSKVLEWQPRTIKRSVYRRLSQLAFDVTSGESQLVEPLDPSGTRPWIRNSLQKT